MQSKCRLDHVTEVAERVVRETEERFELPRGAIVSRKRDQRTVAARAAACHGLYAQGFGLCEIGRAVGRDHSSVAYLLDTHVNKWKVVTQSDTELIVSESEALHHVPSGSVCSLSRCAAVVAARRTACQAMRELGMSFKEIGQVVDRAYTSVISLLRKPAPECKVREVLRRVHNRDVVKVADARLARANARARVAGDSRPLLPMFAVLGERVTVKHKGRSVTFVGQHTPKGVCWVQCNEATVRDPFMDAVAKLTVGQ